MFFAGNTYNTFNGELMTFQRRPGSACGTRARYNPLTHLWTEPPDAAALQKWQRQADRSYSLFGRRLGSAAGGSLSHSGGSGCLARSADTVGSLLRQQSSSGAAGSSGSSKDRNRPASAGGRKTVRAGDTW